MKDTVTTVAINPAMHEIKLDPGNVMCFFGRNHFLSSFAEAPVVIGGHLYPTMEHYYQACKVYALAGPYDAMQIKTCSDPGQVKTLSNRLVSDAGKRKAEVDKWRQSDGIQVMKTGLMEKFRQNPVMREKLLKTGDAMLVQSNVYESMWGVGMNATDFKAWLIKNKGKTVNLPVEIDPAVVDKIPDFGKGKNVLGLLVMEVRERLKKEFGVRPGPQSLIPGLKEALRAEKQPEAMEV